MQISNIDEFELINRLHNLINSNSPEVKIGIGDDGAVIENDPNYQTVVTTDMLIEEVHFLKDKITPFQLGSKALAVNISDVIAMGAHPVHATISLGLPKTTEIKYVEEIYRGINHLAQEYQINIIGGDITSSPDRIVINITLLGKVSENNYLLRSTAKNNDHILITGTLGASKAGLEILLSENYQQLKSYYPALVNYHLQPKPRLKEMQLLKQISPVTSMNDISDGLASELIEITTASQVGAEIYQKKLPISKQTKKLAKEFGNSAFNYALFGGEDYELLFTVPPDKSNEVKRRIETKLKTKVSVIGKILPPQEGTKLITSQNKIELEKRGYKHF